MGPSLLARAGAALVFAAVVGRGLAQSGPGPCGLPPVAAPTAQANIFSEQQEEWLGDAMADVVERAYRPARDPAMSAHLQAIADRLSEHLPPTKLHFRVLLVDSSEVNGFSLAGGRIYITRKLAAVAQNDDELAAVLGHEMGHIASHQFAFETTRDLRRLLGVTALTDRADVYARFQQLMDARYTDKHPSKGGDSDSGQGEADAVGVYVTAAAGYRPASFSEFWDRTTFSEGKTGNGVTDFFGMTKPDQKRLRGMLKLVAALPAGCGGTAKGSTAEFEAWHRKIVQNQAVAVAASLSPVKAVKLTPPLHMDLERLKFSPDGNSILAQDGGSVFVLSRDPLVVQFRIDAEDAQAAQFSPDSQRIVFATPGLHTEEWSLADRKMMTAHEPLLRQDCLMSRLSPDGRTLVCIRMNDYGTLVLALVDAVTGQTAWEKKDFFSPSYMTMLMSIFTPGGMANVWWMQGAFSEDGNYLLIGPGDSKVALDMRTRTPLKIGGALKSKVTGPYAFVGNGEVVGVNVTDLKDSGTFSFPDGTQEKKMNLPMGSMRSVSGIRDAKYVLVPGVKNTSTGLANLGTGMFDLLSKSDALDAWGKFVAAENLDGSVQLAELKETKVERLASVALPESPLGSLRSVSTSPDGKHVAFSTRLHGGVWDLETGRQEVKMLGFTGMVWQPDGTAFVEFPKVGEVERHLSRLSIKPWALKDVAYKLEEKVHLENGLLADWKETKGAWDLTTHKPADGSVAWTKHFADASPRYTRSLGSHELLFSVPLKAGSVKAKLKANGTLGAEAAAVKDKERGRLLEVVNAATGQTSAEMVLELPPNYDGVDGLNRLGDLLYMTESDNRTAVLSLTTGKRLRQIFGRVVGMDEETGRVCTVNRRDEAVVYDVDGKELAHFRSGSALRLASFREKGMRLMLLTADQMVRVVDVAKGDAGQALSGN